jgi:hypothetical protein
MAKIYEVRADGGNRIHSFGARTTREEAELLLAESEASVRKVGGHNQRYWIEEIDITGLFELPPRPTPRERYSTRVKRTSPENAWTTVRVEVMDGDSVVAAYDRNYSMLQTFEPFRQGGRNFALISTHYTATSVLDLATGDVVAGEPPHSNGFCPVGFYVPDWWDVNDGSVFPGSMYWTKDKEWPHGEFGFVWGCVWGDDSSWKVQYLDLSAVQRGELRRDDRFGYVKLASRPGVEAREFIKCWSYEGGSQVEFATLQNYDLATGKRADIEE